MTTLSHDIASTQALAAPLIRKERSTGPVTAARQRRAALIYVTMCLVGLLPLFAGMSAGARAAGLGLWFPGAGFLAVGGWALLLLPVTLALFAVALFAWFGSGMVVAPIIVWMGAALVAGSMARGDIATASPYAVPALVALACGYVYRRTRSLKRAGRAKLDERNRYLPSAVAEVIERATPVAPETDRELTSEDLAALRYVLDRALQPVGELGGFDKIDQFQTASLRYQLNHLGYTLALAQCHYTPSFHGYLSQAQRNLIEQYLQKPIWNYWVYESAWGHLNFTDPDPASKDNIMLTGWFGLHVGMYTSASGDRRYAEPASLTFRLSRRRAFHHDLHSLERSVLQNFQDSEFCLYPCEPNWIYPICNHYGMTSLTLYDRLFGTSYASLTLNRWLDSLDREFTDDSGSVIGLRSALTGIRFPFPAAEAGFADFTNCFAPERARRMWAVARHDIEPLLTKDEAGNARVTLPGDGFDLGNYRRGWAGVYATILNAAHEFGDEEIAAAAQHSLDRDCGRRDDGGILRYTQASNLSNTFAVRARIVRRDDFRNAVTKGPPACVSAGPILAAAKYPDVLVSRARSHGDTLDLVLYPGAQPGAQKLRIEQLRPNAQYALSGASEGVCRADETGAAAIVVDLRGRTPVQIALC
ncbi:MAG TPA: hypothetical protein VMW56_30880 [Candidatus Margulisiibacteriota bacterium]|nr:hypothetical protein [Candidatus Margulisiibacteriota bacterium]